MKKKKYGTDINTKSIVLDDVTSEFLKNLRSIRKSIGFTLDYVASHIGTVHSCVIGYEKGKHLPELLKLIKLAELLNYDISESINYKFFHGKIRAEHMHRKMHYYGFSIIELSRITGYCVRRVSESVNVKPEASISCIYTVLQVFKHEKKLLSLREAITRRKTGDNYD